jgi:hypothetical protein
MEELAAALVKFHREVLLPDVERLVSAAAGSWESRLRDEMRGLFVTLSQRFERLELQSHMIGVAVRRIEDRLDRLVLEAPVQD